MAAFSVGAVQRRELKGIEVVNSGTGPRPLPGARGRGTRRLIVFVALGGMPGSFWILLTGMVPEKSAQCVGVHLALGTTEFIARGGDFLCWVTKF